jgi:hypothetical protein
LVSPTITFNQKHPSLILKIAFIFSCMSCPEKS